MQGFTEKGIKEKLWNFVRNKAGGCKEQNETAAEWLEENPDDPWWYFAIFPSPIFRKGLFVKTKLLWEEGDGEADAFVQIVSIHEEL
jgi:hypothetical protein